MLLFGGNMWVNGNNLANIQTISFTKNTDGNWHLSAGNNLYLGYEWNSAEAAYDAAMDIVNALGFPWIAVGSLAALGSSTTAVLAFNLGALTTAPVDSETPGQGLSPGGSEHTLGYYPWPDYASASAGILALLGNYEFTPDNDVSG